MQHRWEYPELTIVIGNEFAVVNYRWKTYPLAATPGDPFKTCVDVFWKLHELNVPYSITSDFCVPFESKHYNTDEWEQVEQSIAEGEKALDALLNIPLPKTGEQLTLF